MGCYVAAWLWVEGETKHLTDEQVRDRARGDYIGDSGDTGIEIDDDAAVSRAVDEDEG